MFDDIMKMIKPRSNVSARKDRPPKKSTPNQYEKNVAELNRLGHTTKHKVQPGGGKNEARNRFYAERLKQRARLKGM